jgi:SPP1 gp7 family putative phage head morphogenesis protein
MKAFFDANTRLEALENNALFTLYRSLNLARQTLESRVTKWQRALDDTPDAGLEFRKARAIRLIGQLTDTMTAFDNPDATVRTLIAASSTIGTQVAASVIDDLDGITVTRAFVPIEAILALCEQTKESLARRGYDFIQLATDSLAEGLARGDSRSQLVKALRESAQISARAAQRIVRTETLSAFDSAAAFQYRSSGIEFVQWTASLETTGRVCAYCASRHGTIYALDDAPTVPAHPNCRCLRLPVKREWIDGGLVPSPDDYAQERDDLLTAGGHDPTNKPTPFESQLKGITRLRPIRL